MDSKDELPNDMQKYFQKGCNAMSTQQPSQKQRLAQKLQTQPGKEYSFSTKPGLREKKTDSAQVCKCKHCSEELSLRIKNETGFEFYKETSI